MYTYGVASPVLTDESVFNQFLLDAVGICTFLVNFVDGYDNLNTGSLAWLMASIV